MQISIKTRPLKHQDVGRSNETVRNLGPFKALLDALISSGTVVHETDQRTDGLTKEIEEYYWRAEDLYFFKTRHQKISCNKVYHQGVHYLLTKKFGPGLAGRPHFILLCEAIASMAEFYFFLEALVNFGMNDWETQFVKKTRVSGVTIFDDQEYVEKFTFKLIKNASKDPFHSYREAALEMYDHFQYLYAVARNRATGRNVSFEDTFRRARTLKYGPLIYNYSLGNNVLFAVAFGGLESSPEDAAATTACLRLFKSSSGFDEFLGSLRKEKVSPSRQRVPA